MKKINYSFQGLRGLFALGVMFSHCYFLKDFAQSSIIFNSALCKLANVSFFFMISGFFTIQSKSADIPFWQYIKKKMLRIYPLYIIVLALFVGINFLKNNISTFIDWIYLGLNISLLQGWGGLAAVGKFYTIAWFLSSLLFCYIIGYWLIKLKNQNDGLFWKLLYILTAVLLLFKCFTAFFLPTDDLGYYLCCLLPLAGFTDFLIGALLAHLYKSKTAFTPKAQMFFQIFSFAILILSFFMKLHLPINYSRAFLMIPANVLLILAFSTETVFSKKVFGNKFMLFLGNISFEVYLIHFIVISLITKLNFFNIISLRISPFLTLLLCVLITILCAQIYKRIYNYVTKIFKLFGDR